MFCSKAQRRNTGLLIEPGQIYGRWNMTAGSFLHIASREMRDDFSELNCIRKDESLEAKV